MDTTANPALSPAPAHDDIAQEMGNGQSDGQLGSPSSPRIGLVGVQHADFLHLPHDDDAPSLDAPAAPGGLNAVGGSVIAAVFNPFDRESTNRENFPPLDEALAYDPRTGPESGPSIETLAALYPVDFPLRFPSASRRSSFDAQQEARGAQLDELWFAQRLELKMRRVSERARSQSRMLQCAGIAVSWRGVCFRGTTSPVLCWSKPGLFDVHPSAQSCSGRGCALSAMHIHMRVSCAGLCRVTRLPRQPATRCLASRSRTAL